MVAQQSIFKIDSQINNCQPIESGLKINSYDITDTENPRNSTQQTDDGVQIAATDSGIKSVPFVLSACRKCT